MTRIRTVALVGLAMIAIVGLFAFYGSQAPSAVAAPGAGFASPVAASPSPETAAPRVCPEIYAPVTCDNGRTYVNQCYADRAHAKNCVPAGSAGKYVAQRE